MNYSVTTANLEIKGKIQDVVTQLKNKSPDLLTGLNSTHALDMMCALICLKWCMQYGKNFDKWNKIFNLIGVRWAIACIKARDKEDVQVILIRSDVSSFQHVSLFCWKQTDLKRICIWFNSLNPWESSMRACEDVKKVQEVRFGMPAVKLIQYHTCWILDIYNVC